MSTSWYPIIPYAAISEDYQTTFTCLGKSKNWTIYHFEKRCDVAAYFMKCKQISFGRKLLPSVKRLVCWGTLYCHTHLHLKAIQLCPGYYDWLWIDAALHQIFVMNSTREGDSTVTSQAYWAQRKWYGLICASMFASSVVTFTHRYKP